MLFHNFVLNSVMLRTMGLYLIYQPVMQKETRLGCSFKSSSNSIEKIRESESGNSNTTRTKAKDRRQGLPYNCLFS